MTLSQFIYRARVNPFAGFHRGGGGGGMHEISPDELFNMFFQVSECEIQGLISRKIKYCQEK